MPDASTVLVESVSVTLTPVVRVILTPSVLMVLREEPEPYDLELEPPDENDEPELEDEPDEYDLPLPDEDPEEYDDLPAFASGARQLLPFTPRPTLKLKECA